MTKQRPLLQGGIECERKAVVTKACENWAVWFLFTELETITENQALLLISFQRFLSLYIAHFDLNIIFWEWKKHHWQPKVSQSVIFFRAIEQSTYVKIFIIKALNFLFEPVKTNYRFKEKLTMLLIEHWNSTDYLYT